jgi:E3 ubiquitin-protein ligase HUWE1
MEMAMDDDDDDGSDGETDDGTMSEGEIDMGDEDDEEMVGTFINEDDIEYVEGDSDDEEEGGEWLDEPEDGEDGEGGEEIVEDGDGFQGDPQVAAGIINEDDIDDGDSEDPDSYTDEEEMYLTGELEFEAGLEEEMRRDQPEDPALRFMSHDARRQRISELLSDL